MNTEGWVALGTILSATISGVAAVYASRAAKGADDVRELRSLLVEHLRDHAKG